MIEEKITGSRKNIEWMRKKLKADPQVEVIRISGPYPVKGMDGLYCLYVKYRRIVKLKHRPRW